MKNNFNIIILLLMFCSFVFSSCYIETYSTRKLSANEEILKYIGDNELNAVPDSTGLVFIKIKEGEGDFPKNGDKIAFHYTGYYIDGKVFETSYNKQYPLIVELGQDMLIKGMEDAFKKMNKGCKAMVIIPFYLAYDDMENAPVPPYSNLIFELELIDYTLVRK